MNVPIRPIQRDSVVTLPIVAGDDAPFLDEQRRDELHHRHLHRRRKPSRECRSRERWRYSWSSDWRKQAVAMCRQQPARLTWPCDASLRSLMRERYRGATLAGGRNPDRVPPTAMLRPFNRAGQDYWVLGTVSEERSARSFDLAQVKRLSHIMGRTYNSARMAISTIDDQRDVPVISQHGIEFSGFHQGSGETMATEFLKADFPKYGLVLIDEIELSLHPRAQRRLIRDLAEISAQREIQIIISTHSPYILEELPPEARMYILISQGVKKIIPGVNPNLRLQRWMMIFIRNAICTLRIKPPKSC